MTISTPTYFDVFTLLSDNGFGVIGVDLFGGEWGAVDEQILVLEGVGTPVILKTEYENPGVQILVRGVPRGRDKDVYAKAKPISDFLLNLPADTLVNNICYAGFEETSNIAPLGKDENERFIYSMNFSTFRNRE